MSEMSEGDLAGILGKALADGHEVPPQWREAARAAFTWRNVDDELLAMTYDSHLEGSAAVRGEADARSLEFTGGGLTLEVELTDGRIMGQLEGQTSTEVTFESADGRSRSTATDESGFFSLTGEDHGLVRFAVSSGEARLVTQWVVL